jgi:NAD(P)-dependent dehydrogenase (short-subunit alcohol dehydrogenase family)
VLALGQAGMTVYVTGRSQAASDSEYGGTVAETARQIDEAGGHGIAVPVDHGDDAQVAELFERIKREHGRLDLLVNNAAKVLASTANFWERPLETADLITVGLRSHYVASYYAAPLLIANGRGLIVNTGHYGAVSYHLGPAYGAQKAGADKLAGDMAKELRPFGVAAISIWMGGLDTERVRASLPVEALTSRETPQFTGRVIAALYASANLLSYSGRTLIGAELGAELGVTDIDGSQPTSARDRLGAPPAPHPSLA